MEARGGTVDGAEHALVEVAELLSAESGRAATDSGDFDVGAIPDVWHGVGPFWICELGCASVSYALAYFFVVWS